MLIMKAVTVPRSLLLPLSVSLLIAYYTETHPTMVVARHLEYLTQDQLDKVFRYQNMQQS